MTRTSRAPGSVPVGSPAGIWQCAAVARAGTAAIQSPHRRHHPAVRLQPHPRAHLDAAIPLVTGLFEQFDVGLRVPREGEHHGPGPAVDPRVLHPGFVVNGVGIDSVKRSATRTALLTKLPALSSQTSPFAFVTSTTNVLPSQCPLESPIAFRASSAHG